MRPVTQVRGTAVMLDRPDIDTDQIIPAAWLKQVERTGFGPGLFSAWRADPGFALNQPGAGQAKILITGPNFGCGSSREHAVWALRDFGFEAVIAPSFADIFRANSISAGLLTAQVDDATVAALSSALTADPAAIITLDVAERTITLPASGLTFPFALPGHARTRLIQGLDDIDITLKHTDAITSYEESRPAWLPSSRPSARAST